MLFVKKTAEKLLESHHLLGLIPLL